MHRYKPTSATCNFPLNTRCIRACRSAKLAAAGIYAVLQRQGFFSARRRVVIAVDGGVYVKFPHYRTMLEECLWSMLIEDLGLEKAQPVLSDINFIMAQDGSGMGAAVLAAAAAT